jgi:hypothetical protein
VFTLNFSRQKRKRLTQLLHELQATKVELSKENRRWKEMAADAAAKKKIFIASVAAPRCEKYGILITTTSRNIDLIELLLHRPVKEKTAPKI